AGAWPVPRPDPPASARLDGPGRKDPRLLSKLLGDLLGDVGEIPLEVVLLLANPQQGGVLLAPRRGELLGPLAQRKPGRLELLLPRCDLVAGGTDRVDGELHLVAEAPDPGDDVVVLILKGPHVRGAGEQVIEAVGLEKHRDQ